MTSFADAFVKLRIEPAELRKDTVEALKGGDVRAAGDQAGKSWVAGVRGRVSQASSMITGVFAGGAAAIASESVKAATEFQEGLTNLVTGAGVAEKNLGVISSGIKKIAVQTATSTDQLLKGEYTIASAGYAGADSLKVLKAAAEGAKTGNADLGTVADAVTTILKDYALKGGDATKVTSQLISTVAHGKTHLQDLAGALSRVLPTAAALKISFPQVAGAMAAMTARGTSARLAATGLNATLIAIATPSVTAAKAMDALSLTSKQYAEYQKAVQVGNTKLAKSLLDQGHGADDLAKTLTKHGLIAALQQVSDLALQAGPRGSAAYTQALKTMLAGTNGLRVGLQLTGKNMSNLVDSTHAIAKSADEGGKSVAGFADVQNDASFKTARLKEQIETTGITIGQKLLPVVANVLGFISTHTTDVVILAAGLGGLALSITILAKAWQAYKIIAAAVTGVQKLCTDAALGTRLELGALKVAELAQAGASRVAAAATWLWNAAFEANPIGLVIVGIVALIGVVILCYTHFRVFRDVVQDVWKWIKNNWPLLLEILTGPIGIAVLFIIRHWNMVKAAFTGAVHLMRQAFADFVGGILDYFGTIIDGAADAFGWIPLIGGKLRTASHAFDQFKQNVNSSLAGINGRTVNVGIGFGITHPRNENGGIFNVAGKAGGGLITGPGTGTSDTAGLYALSNKEYVHTAAAVAHYGTAFMDAVNARKLPVMAAGGLAVRAHTPSEPTIQAAVWPSVEELAKRFFSTSGGGRVFSSALGVAIGAFASSFAGRVPYVWGGSTPGGWDCSGMTEWIYEHFGFSPPRTAAAQQAWARPTPFPAVGGLAFFAGADGTAANAGHVGIILGANRMVDAYGTGYGTRFDSIYGSSGAVGGFGIPPNAKGFARGGVLTEPLLGVGLRTGQAYTMGEAGREYITSEGGMTQLAGLLGELIDAVHQNSGDTADGVAAALGGAGHRSAYRAQFSARG